MGCSNSKEYNNKDELDLQNIKFIFEIDTSSNNKNNNAEELEKLIITYIKNKESLQQSLFECDEFIASVRLLLTRIQQDYLQETKLNKYQ